MSVEITPSPHTVISCPSDTSRPAAMETGASDLRSIVLKIERSGHAASMPIIKAEDLDVI